MTIVSAPYAKIEQRNRDSTAVALAWLELFVQLRFSLYNKCMSESNSLFDYTTLSFELYLHKHHVPFASIDWENQKYRDFSNPAILEKGQTNL